FDPRSARVRRGRMAALRAKCRLHAVPDLRLAAAVATPYRDAPRRATGHRCRDPRRWTDHLYPAFRHRSRRRCAAVVLARPGFERLQLTAHPPRLLAAHPGATVPRAVEGIAQAHATRAAVPPRLDRT